MARTPKVSIVIPVYNTEKYLCQCLDSVINQTLTDFEIICVDDGSTDESPSILSNYEKRDSRFKVISQSNKGPGTARNIGMNQASGEYLIFLDSDDWFESDFLSKLVETCEIHQSDISICRSVEFDTETGKESPSNWMLKTELLPSKKTVFSPEEAATVLFQFTYGMAWDKLYRRSFLMNEGISFPNLKNSEDLAFVFPTLLAAKRIAVIEKVLVHHRINRSSSVSNTRSSQPSAPYDAFQIVKHYLKTHHLEKQYEQSFLNWAMEFLIWHISNMDDPDIQKIYFKEFRKKWDKEINFEAYGWRFYRNKIIFLKYLLVKYLPFCLFTYIVSWYKKLKNQEG